MKRAHRPSLYPDLSPAQCEALLPGAHWQDDLAADPTDELYAGPSAAKEARDSEAYRVVVWPDNYTLPRPVTELGTGGNYLNRRLDADLHQLLRYLCYGSRWPWLYGWP